jgi:AcrR family transcriptional regulator
MGRKDLTEERQSLILDAAERCIAKFGVQGATLENIAGEAGLNRGLIHHYVGNRDDVIQAMVKRLLGKYQASFDEYASSRPNNHDNIKIIVDYYFDAWFEFAPEDDAIIVSLLAESERNPQIKKVLIKLYDGFERIIAVELARFFPEADKKKLHHISYALMLLAFSHATMTWLGLEQASKANMHSIASNLVSTLA